MQQHPCMLSSYPSRLSLVAYELTGQLLGGEVGSVTMFAIPEEYGQKALAEHFLQVGLTCTVGAVCSRSTSQSDMCHKHGTILVCLACSSLQYPPHRQVSESSKPVHTGK
jgi:hypothetical protein